MPRQRSATVVLLALATCLLGVIAGPVVQAAADVRPLAVRIAPTYGTSQYLGDPSPYDLVVSDSTGRPEEVDVTIDVVGGDLASAARVTTDVAGSAGVVVVPTLDTVTVTATVVDPAGAPGASGRVTTMVWHRFTTLPTAVVQGSPVVGEVLSAVPAGVVPEPSETVYIWLVGYNNDPFGGQLVHTGPTYTVREADVGKPVRLLVHAQRPYYDAANVYATPTAPVTRRGIQFGVNAPQTAVAGRRVRVSVAAAATGEALSFYLGARLVGQTVAGAQAGLPAIQFKAPRRLAGKSRTISVRTAQTNRSGRVKLKILPATRSKT